MKKEEVIGILDEGIKDGSIIKFYHKPSKEYRYKLTEIGHKKLSMWKDELEAKKMKKKTIKEMNLKYCNSRICPLVHAGKHCGYKKEKKE